MMPDRHGVLIIVGVDSLEPAIPLVLLGGHGGILTPSSVPVFTRALGAQDPDKLGDGIDQGMDFVFGSLARGDVDAGDDEILDVLVRVHVGGDRYLKVQEHLLPWANQGLETDG